MILSTISPESEVLGAPSHDVLEDWATIQWVERNLPRAEQSAVHFSRLDLRLSGIAAGLSKVAGGKADK